MSTNIKQYKILITTTTNRQTKWNGKWEVHTLELRFVNMLFTLIQFDIDKKQNTKQLI